jgi:membrane-associated protease RseP (regulator of RpoE activity)
VSSDLTRGPGSQSTELQNLAPAAPIEISTVLRAESPSRKTWILPLILFCCTLVSTTFAGLFYASGDDRLLVTAMVSFLHPSILILGLPFSFTFLAILLAHELGHYFTCRHYGINCTLPFFIPLPISIAGTLGAFIRIKSPFQHKRALFDVGIAGPLAGFAIALPSLFLGVARSRLIPKGGLAGSYNFGEPLIFQWVGRLMLGYRPASQDMIAHPIAMAAWFGLLATSLNLLPIWQLDGGHIAYAIFGSKLQKRLSIAGACALVLLSFLSWPIPSYLVFGVLILALGARFRFYHPPTLSEEFEVGPARRFLGALALAILICSFTPVPISLS